MKCCSLLPPVVTRGTAMFSNSKVAASPSLSGCALIDWVLSYNKMKAIHLKTKHLWTMPWKILKCSKNVLKPSCAYIYVWCEAGLYKHACQKDIVWTLSLGSSFFPSTERQIFLATWKDIPNDNESQFQIKDCHLSSGKMAWLEKRAHRLPPSWATSCFKKIQAEPCQSQNQFVNEARL